MRWFMGFVAVACLAAAVLGDGGGEDHALDTKDDISLVRNERGAKSKDDNCRFVKGQWSECDPKTNMRSRTLTLKKGDVSTCPSSKIIEKKCIKACRYEKSQWSVCGANGVMSRIDKLKANSDPSCEANRQVTKKCNKNKPPKPTKVKGRRNRQ